MPRTEAYLAHNSIPVQFTEEDFDQVLSGNFVTKVVYLPDPKYQELAISGVETLVDIHTTIAAGKVTAVVGRTGAAEFREQGIAATRQLAKRQLTWLRGQHDVRWFDPRRDRSALHAARTLFLREA